MLLNSWNNTFLSFVFLVLKLLFSHSVLSDSATPWIEAHQTFLLFTISWSLLKLIFIESVMPWNHLILCRPLLILPWIFASIRVFSNESVLCIRWAKYWSFSFSISPSNVGVSKASLFLEAEGLWIQWHWKYYPKRAQCYACKTISLYQEGQSHGSMLEQTESQVPLRQPMRVSPSVSDTILNSKGSSNLVA